eukprot:GEMP01028122.1.p1 GENE.GEMP01028122.1~~GEMP01028122.1.p1  ORF type:complete len:444 (+),score=97.50 GEMP01028122.1:60-1391(+)
MSGNVLFWDHPEASLLAWRSNNIHKDTFSRWKKAVRLKPKAKSRARRLDLAELMCKKYDSVAHGWRAVLDKTSNGIVTQVEFFRALRNFAFTGNAHALWNELDSGNWGFITFEDFAPAMARELLELYHLLLKRWGDVTAILKKSAIGSNHTVPFHAFFSICADLPFKATFRDEHINKMASCLNRRATTAGISQADVFWFHAFYVSAKKTRLLEEFVTLMKSRYEDEFHALAAIKRTKGKIDEVEPLTLPDFGTLCEPFEFKLRKVGHAEHVTFLFKLVATDGIITHTGLRALYVWHNYLGVTRRRLQNYRRHQLYDDEKPPAGAPQYAALKLGTELSNIVQQILSEDAEFDLRSYLQMFEQNIAILEEIEEKLKSKGVKPVGNDVTNELANIQLARLAYHSAAKQLLQHAMRLFQQKRNGGPTSLGDDIFTCIQAGSRSPGTL